MLRRIGCVKKRGNSVPSTVSKRSGFLDSDYSVTRWTGAERLIAQWRV